MLFHPLEHADPIIIASMGSWLGLAALGAFHGLNPAMGWLFAVALGLQRNSGWTIVRALVYVTGGHAASLIVVAAFFLFLGTFIALTPLRILSGAVLLVFGAYKLFRYYRHPRWVGMQVGARDLVVWSFLMATAHGAGLMLAPILLSLSGGNPSSHLEDLAHHGDFIALSDAPAVWGVGLGIHTTAMLLVMLPVAMVVYKKVGLAFLRRGWINVDFFWAFALIVAGALTVLLIFL